MLNIEKAISVAELPHALFFGDAALAEHGKAATAYESAVADFELHGDEAELWEALDALGYEPAEIQWHVAHRSERMRQGYVA
jgi:hypothetical protein